MAQFRGTIRGTRGEASRLGGKSSGMTAKVNGWNSGVEVRAFTDDKGMDCFALYSTGGSNGAVASEYLGLVDGGSNFIPADERYGGR